MRLAEQTIKECFKHILEKTSTTTRTGIIMKIIHLGLCQTPPIPSPLVAIPTMSGVPSEVVASAEEPRSLYPRLNAESTSMREFCEKGITMTRPLRK
jgi:hypothetical protein